ncbi:MAG: hypothetical protein NT144_13245 [Bacteroidia bacterium]|nr:hypothetical protein [Bacteroidia bacterium]
MIDPVNEFSDISHETGCACCNGHNDQVSNEISRRKFMQVTGASALGTVALSGLSWSALASIQTGKQNNSGRSTLVVNRFLLMKYQPGATRQAGGHGEGSSPKTMPPGNSCAYRMSLKPCNPKQISLLNFSR